jgi:N-acetyl-gamma-glutamylphosphate reductase
VCEQVDLSSRTLKALQSAQEGGRAVIAKASDSVRTFGAYAVSRAVADTELVLRVGVVVASEITSRITPMLLPSARGISLQCPTTQPQHQCIHV